MADRNEQPGILGSLPRSRPGRRSEKRSTGTAGGAAASKPKAGRPSPARSATARGVANPKGAGAARRPRAPRAPATNAGGGAPGTATADRKPRAQSDPLSEAVRLAGKLAEAGARTASGLLKRFPGR